MRLALAGLCSARWSEQILDEWSRSLSEKRQIVSVGNIERCRELMNRHIGDALVTGYEPTIPSLTLPDPDDRHVLAAAIYCGANVIVTFNLKDFPESVLVPHGIEAIHPDEFLMRMLQADAETVCSVIQEQRAQLTKPPVDAEAFLARLVRQGLPKSVDVLRTMIGQI
jgi:predicted nucleic acid-binding protein